MADGSAPVLATEDLHVGFGRRPVLRGLDLRVGAGEIYGYLGRNGAGKTTTVKTVLGVLSPQRGVVRLGDRAFRKVPPSARRTIGYSSQEQVFYEWMHAGDLGRFVGAFHPTWDTGLYAGLLRKLGVDRATRVGALSTGTRRKLALALALAARPPLVLLDEPTAGVDPVTRTEILAFLQEMVRSGDHTVLFSTHYIAEVEAVATALGVLRDGKLFYQGPPSGFSARARWCHAPPAGSRVLERRGDQCLAWAEPEAWDGIPATPATLEEAFVAVARDEPGG